MTHVIVLEDVRVDVAVGFWGRKRPLLRGVNLAVEAGTVHGFVGRNGAGKSTTIKTLIGAVTPTGGRVAVLGESPKRRAVRARIGYLPELPRLPATLTPGEFVTLHAVLAGLPKDRAAKKAATLLSRVGLQERAGDRIGGFSKGMQQRVGLAAALVGDPELLILDEPSTGLDPMGRALVRDIIADEQQKGHTVFFSSHVLPDVEALCDRITLIDKGRTLADGTMSEVLGDSFEEVEVRFVAPETFSLDAFGIPCERRGDTYIARLAPDAELAQVLAQLDAAGCRLRGVEAHRPSLEDRLVSLLKQEGE